MTDLIETCTKKNLKTKASTETLQACQRRFTKNGSIKLNSTTLLERLKNSALQKENKITSERVRLKLHLLNVQYDLSNFSLSRQGRQ